MTQYKLLKKADTFDKRIKRAMFSKKNQKLTKRILLEMKFPLYRFFNRVRYKLGLLKID